MLIQSLNQLKANIVSYLIARYEGKNPPEALRDYMRAFEGGFSPDMKFTLHTPVVNKLVMYVHEENCGEKGTPKSEFAKRCKVITRTLVEIADFIMVLQEQEYINVEYKGNVIKMPPEGFQKYWRRYERFYPNESEPIIFVKSISIAPTRKLYELRGMRADGN
jgi:hypothetical protein